jgi:metal-responsive CopG/Arc/MetJ family transcriptional regulator
MRIKSKKKLKIYFSMDQDLHEMFEKHIDKNILDKSRLIEKLIEEYMKKNQ